MARKKAAPTATTAPKATDSGKGLDYATFMEMLPHMIDRGRLANAISMLRTERFKLFAQVDAESVVGVVRSQSSKERVYSCRLTKDGDFACCTQNLRHCGGLRGAVCKHLLVLIVGLARSGQLDPDLAERWTRASRARRPHLDKDVMSATFLRYKGAEAGEIDWRPTETIPEDYYAL